MHSHKNTSEGGRTTKRMPIGEPKAKMPPAGASNSYEQVSKKLMAHDDSSLNKKHYSREKMANK